MFRAKAGLNKGEQVNGVLHKASLKALSFKLTFSLSFLLQIT